MVHTRFLRNFLLLGSRSGHLHLPGSWKSGQLVLRFRPQVVTLSCVLILLASLSLSTVALVDTRKRGALEGPAQALLQLPGYRREFLLLVSVFILLLVVTHD